MLYNVQTTCIYYKSAKTTGLCCTMIKLTNSWQVLALTTGSSSGTSFSVLVNNVNKVNKVIGEAKATKVTKFD